MPRYQTGLLTSDLVAGVTLASFVLPESMAYATLAGVPPYFGIYCCLVGGLVFAFFTTSKQMAIGPTSAISLMVGSTVATLSGGDPARWAAIAALSALAVALICFISFGFRLSSLVNFISDSILLGFKAGAALSIMVTQVPKLFGVEGGGAHFFERIWLLVQRIPDSNWVVLLFGLVALLLLFLGDRYFPGKPVSLAVVILSIVVVSLTNLASFGIHVTGNIPGTLPSFGRPSLRFKDVDGVLELSIACFLMGYIETVSAARTFAIKHGYDVNARQELLSMGFANLGTAFFSGYVVAGGLSQSTVNDKSGAKTPLSLIFCSAALSIILLFLTGLLYNLPEVMLAAIVLHAVSGLIKVKELKRLRQLSRMEFTVAMFAFGSVLLFGILKGVLLAVMMSLVMLIKRWSDPYVAVLGRIGESHSYSDVARHPENIQYPGILILRPETAIVYFNSENLQTKIAQQILDKGKDLKLVVLDLSVSIYVDVSGSKMLLQLSEQLEKQGVLLRIVDAHSKVRDILRKQGIEKMVGHVSRKVTIADVVEEYTTGNTGMDT
ncbi:SulP family inorganic anion transporter [Flavihumibacter rivuli]|nr:SulP family inorganic anion transporter [Flavihumibacter rivuli]ULQ56112.1 SulP family inorganic anion transporter [Flavihumibacter rivuli]